MKKSLAAVLPAALGLVLSGCHDPNSPSPSGTPPSSPSGSQSGVPPSPSAITSGVPAAKLVIYVLNPKATGAEDVLMPHPAALVHPETPAKDAVDALLQSSRSPIQPGTALRGISVDDGQATLDFSQNPVNETGGESGQSAALNALAMTLGQFPEISTFQIEVKGRPQTAFGEFTTDGPQAVIRPAEGVLAKGNGP